MDKILVIDDEKPTLLMFQLTLKAYGYEVLTAENGTIGIELFERERPPLVLTDIKMPGMDGIQVLKRLKEIEPKTEVIVITGHGDMDLAIKALNLDAADFINKPIQRQVLEQALSRAQERRRLAAGKQQEIMLELRNQGAVIHIRGTLTAHSEDALKGAFAEAAASDRPKIVLHFPESTVVNGAGIAILTQLLLEAGRDRRPVALAGLTENLQKIFTIVGISRLAESFQSVEEALA